MWGNFERPGQSGRFEETCTPANCPFFRKTKNSKGWQRENLPGGPPSGTGVGVISHVGLDAAKTGSLKERPQNSSELAQVRRR